jgi:hypothetical protein
MHSSIHKRSCCRDEVNLALAFHLKIEEAPGELAADADSVSLKHASM